MHFVALVLSCSTSSEKTEFEVSKVRHYCTELGIFIAHPVQFPSYYYEFALSVRTRTRVDRLITGFVKNATRRVKNRGVLLLRGRLVIILKMWIFGSDASVSSSARRPQAA